MELINEDKTPKSESISLDKQKANSSVSKSSGAYLSLKDKSSDAKEGSEVNMLKHN